MKNKIRIVVKVKKNLAQFASTSAMATTNHHLHCELITTKEVWQ
jgi:hypothetical protein